HLEFTTLCCLQTLMSQIPDLVRDSELETHFRPDCSIETVHTYHQRSVRSRRQPLPRSEHWRRVKRIGGGGFGSVWLEQCTQGGRGDGEVRAVKQIEIDQHSTQLDCYRELEAIAKFSQRKYEEWFVKSFGWYKGPAHLFIAMEYLELGDLYTYVHRSPPLSESEVKDITYQILDGLRLMHENEFTHRDLKLHNILLKSCPPNEWWVKIADFGISKRIEDGLGAPTTTKGTPGYMAPELLGFTERSLPYAIDIWAVGEVMFQMFTKEPTFKSPGQLARYVNNPSNFPSSLLRAARVSQLGVDFILSLMCPVPDDRITAQEALNHSWMDQSLSHPASTAPPHFRSSALANIDSLTEDFASWDTITSKAPATTISKDPKETKTPAPSQTTHSQNTWFESPQNIRSPSNTGKRTTQATSRAGKPDPCAESDETDIEFLKHTPTDARSLHGQPETRGSMDRETGPDSTQDNDILDLEALQHELGSFFGESTTDTPRSAVETCQNPL
ncbi:hypothetical protein ARAM_002632, partial [Aspergillus rambellii]